MTVSTSAAVLPNPTPQPVLARFTPLGTMKVNWGLEQCETWWSRDLVGTGKQLGATEGYGTLKEAKFAMHEATRTAKIPTAIILQQGDRYMGYRMLTRTLKGYERDGSPLWHNTRERPENYDIMDVRPEALDPRVRALVDDRVVHTFQRKSPGATQTTA